MESKQFIIQESCPSVSGTKLIKIDDLPINEPIQITSFHNQLTRYGPTVIATTEKGEIIRDILSVHYHHHHHHHH